MKRAVIVICDSLRADLITPRDAPFLSEFGQRSARFANHRSVFPSTTRTSAASIATGCLPARHGLLGNTMAIDEGDGLVCLSVGKPDFRDRLHRATGRTLHMPTLAERVSRQAGPRSRSRTCRPARPISSTPTALAGSTTRPAASAPAAARCQPRKGSRSRRAPKATALRPSGFARKCSAGAPRQSRCCGSRSRTIRATTPRSARRHTAAPSRAPTRMSAASPRPWRRSIRRARTSSSSSARITEWRRSRRRSISMGC